MKNISKLPKRLAIAGVIIGFCGVALYWYILTFNPFSLPTAAQAQAMGNYSAPKLYWFTEDVVFVLCPASLFFFFAIGIDGIVAWVMWGCFALLNGPIYYGVGQLMVALLKRRSHLKPQPGNGRVLSERDSDS